MKAESHPKLSKFRHSGVIYQDLKKNLTLSLINLLPESRTGSISMSMWCNF